MTKIAVFHNGCQAALAQSDQGEIWRQGDLRLVKEDGPNGFRLALYRGATLLHSRDIAAQQSEHVDVYIPNNIQQFDPAVHIKAFGTHASRFRAEALCQTLQAGRQVETWNARVEQWNGRQYRKLQLAHPLGAHTAGAQEGERLYQYDDVMLELKRGANIVQYVGQVRVQQLGTQYRIHFEKMRIDHQSPDAQGFASVLHGYVDLPGNADNGLLVLKHLELVRSALGQYAVLSAAQATPVASGPTSPPPAVTPQVAPTPPVPSASQPPSTAAAEVAALLDVLRTHQSAPTLTAEESKQIHHPEDFMKAIPEMHKQALENILLRIVNVRGKTNHGSLTDAAAHWKVAARTGSTAYYRALYDSSVQNAPPPVVPTPPPPPPPPPAQTASPAADAVKALVHVLRAHQGKPTLTPQENESVNNPPDYLKAIPEMHKQDLERTLLRIINARTKSSHPSLEAAARAWKLSTVPGSRGYYDALYAVSAPKPPPAAPKPPAQPTPPTPQPKTTQIQQEIAAIANTFAHVQREAGLTRRREKQLRGYYDPQRKRAITMPSAAQAEQLRVFKAVLLDIYQSLAPALHFKTLAEVQKYTKRDPGDYVGMFTHLRREFKIGPHGLRMVRKCLQAIIRHRLFDNSQPLKPNDLAGTHKAFRSHKHDIEARFRLATQMLFPEHAVVTNDDMYARWGEKPPALSKIATKIYIRLTHVRRLNDVDRTVREVLREAHEAGKVRFTLDSGELRAPAHDEQRYRYRYNLYQQLYALTTALGKSLQEPSMQAVYRAYNVPTHQALLGVMRAAIAAYVPELEPMGLADVRDSIDIYFNNEDREALTKLKAPVRMYDGTVGSVALPKDTLMVVFSKPTRHWQESISHVVKNFRGIFYDNEPTCALTLYFVNDTVMPAADVAALEAQALRELAQVRGIAPLLQAQKLRVVVVAEGPNATRAAAQHFVASAVQHGMLPQTALNVFTMPTAIPEENTAFEAALWRHIHPIVTTLLTAEEQQDAPSNLSELLLSIKPQPVSIAGMFAVLRQRAIQHATDPKQFALTAEDLAYRDMLLKALTLPQFQLSVTSAFLQQTPKTQVELTRYRHTAANAVYELARIVYNDASIKNLGQIAALQQQSLPSGAPAILNKLLLAARHYTPRIPTTIVAALKQASIVDLMATEVRHYEQVDKTNVFSLRLSGSQHWRTTGRALGRYLSAKVEKSAPLTPIKVHLIGERPYTYAEAKRREKFFREGLMQGLSGDLRAALQGSGSIQYKAQTTAYNRHVLGRIGDILRSPGAMASHLAVGRAVLSKDNNYLSLQEPKISWEHTGTQFALLLRDSLGGDAPNIDFTILLTVPKNAGEGGRYIASDAFETHMQGELRKYFTTLEGINVVVEARAVGPVSEENNAPGTTRPPQSVSPQQLDDACTGLPSVSCHMDWKQVSVAGKFFAGALVKEPPTGTAMDDYLYALAKHASTHGEKMITFVYPPHYDPASKDPYYQAANGRDEATKALHSAVHAALDSGRMRELAMPPENRIRVHSTHITNASQRYVHRAIGVVLVPKDFDINAHGHQLQQELLKEAHIQMKPIQDAGTRINPDDERNTGTYNMVMGQLRNIGTPYRAVRVSSPDHARDFMAMYVTAEQRAQFEAAIAPLRAQLFQVWSFGSANGSSQIVDVPSFAHYTGNTSSVPKGGHVVIIAPRGSGMTDQDAIQTFAEYSNIDRPAMHDALKALKLK